MKSLPVFLLVALAACGADTPPLEVPQPVLDGLSTQTAAELTAARTDLLGRPDDAQLAGRYGMLLQAYRQDEAALTLYEYASSLDPESYRWAYYHAYMLESLGQPDAAIIAYRNASQIDSSYAPGQLRLAKLLLEHGQQTEARATFDAILDTQPGFSPAAIGLAQVMLSVGEDSGALTAFKKVLARDASNAKAHYGLAQIYRSRGEADTAAEHLRLFEQYRGVQPLSPDRLLSEIGVLNQSDRPSMQRARNSLSRGDVRGAINQFEEAIRRNPDNAGARVSLVGLYSAVNDFENAEKHYNDAMLLVPANVKLHFSYGFSQQRRGLHASAIEAFNDALTLNPDDADSLAYLGVSQLALGDRDAARASLRKAVAANPQQREGNARLGQMLLENGDAENAARYLTNATRRDDRYSITYLILVAEAWQKLDNVDEAGKARRRALGLAQKFGDDRAAELAETDQ